MKLSKMHLSKKEQLIQKGWSEQEIKNAESILDKTELKDLFLSKITFWSALVVIIFANLIVSLILIPFLTVLNHLVLYSIIIILAATIGFLYNFLITNIGHLEKKHHLLAAIIIPLIALVNVIIMVTVANNFIDNLKLNNPPHNLWITALIFAIAFILPYLIHRALGKHHFWNNNLKTV